MANRSSKRGKDNFYQTSLFDVVFEENSTLIERSKDDLPQSSVTDSLLNTQADKDNLKITEDSVLFLPDTYESIVKKIGRDNAELANFVIPVTQFEKEIIQILADISTAGYLVFLYGVSGVGKSTFTGSLKFQRYIPVQKIVSIDATALDRNSDQPKLKLLLETIRLESENFFKDHDEQATNDKLCIVIEYLENLEDEDQNRVRACLRSFRG